MVIESFYFLRYFFRICRYKSTESSDAGKMLLPVSVVICIRNECANLKVLLPALLRQDYPDFDICLVADRSGPETLELLRNFASENTRIQLTEISETPAAVSPKKHALTKGIASAKHEILLLTDADCLPAGDNWLRTMTAGFDAESDAVLGLSPYRKEKTWLNRLIQFDTLFTAAQFTGMALAGKAYMGLGRNLSYRKSLFANNGGFRSHAQILSGDDDLFINRAARQGRVQVCLHPDGFTTSAPVQSFGKWLSQKRRHFSAGKHYKRSDQLRLGIFHLARSLGWLAILLLAFSGHGFMTAAGLFTLRMLFWLPLNICISRRTGNEIRPIFLPMLDFIHTICVFAIGMQARFFPPKEWK